MMRQTGIRLGTERGAGVCQRCLWQGEGIVWILMWVEMGKVQLDGMSDTLARTEPCTERWMVSRIPSRSYGQHLEALGQLRV